MLWCVTKTFRKKETDRRPSDLQLVVAVAALGAGIGGYPFPAWPYDLD